MTPVRRRNRLGYLKSQKNDANGAEAICEAVSRPNMRFVPSKSIEQQDLQALHRIRSRMIGSRTQVGNQIRQLQLLHSQFEFSRKRRSRRHRATPGAYECGKLSLDIGWRRESTFASLVGAVAHVEAVHGASTGTECGEKSSRCSERA